MDRILDSRLVRRKLQYLVQWKGYDVSHNSWEPADHVVHAKQLVEDFHRQCPSTLRTISMAAFSSLQFRLIPPPMTDVVGKSWDMGIVVARVGTSH